MIDLHCHSTASDGRLGPSDLVAAAAAQGVTTLALTDHDSIDGLARARAAAQAHDMRLINGVEISVTWQRRTLHIVGLGVDPDNAVLRQGLAELQQIRADRAQRIGAKLEKLGLDQAFARASESANGGQVTRSHYARLLVDAGLAKDNKQAFKRYLGSGKPASVQVQWTSLEAAIDWIHAAGGKAVLAHPLLYPQTASWRRRMLAAFCEAGGDALEVCCGHSSADQIQTSARDARNHGLMGSVGSDFHSPEQRWLKLGRLAALPTGIIPVWEHLSATAY